MCDHETYSQTPKSEQRLSVMLLVKFELFISSSLLSQCVAGLHLADALEIAAGLQPGLFSWAGAVSRCYIFP